MADDELEHLAQIRQAKLARLRQLQIRAAHLGTNTPPEVSIEIETIGRDVEALDATLRRPSVSPEVQAALGPQGMLELLEYRLETTRDMLAERIDRNREAAEERHQAEVSARLAGDGLLRTLIKVLAVGEILVFVSIFMVLMLLVFRLGG
jgi:hypothetical protein